MTVTVILIGQGGELDRKDVTVDGLEVTMADVANACDWIVSSGDTIKIVDERE